MNAPLFYSSHPGRAPLTLLAREEVSSSCGDRSAEPETITKWQDVHERIVALGKERAGHERQVCRWLLCAERLGVFARCGHASLREYAERMLGLSPRQTEERLRVGRALRGL